MVSICKKIYKKKHVYGRIYSMKILEVRDGFIKFEADSSLSLSSFIQVSGLAKSYIAQVIQIKRSGINSIAIAKILFLYDGSLQPYDKTLPPEDSEIKDFTFNIINNSINANEPVIAGIMPDKNFNIIIDASSFDKKMVMSIDDKDENNTLIRNLTKQFNNLNKKVIIIDTLGIINAKKYTAGKDFKLPLDTASLAFMYQDCLNDATSDSKSLIIEIFRDLAEYSKTVPFVPFKALKNIVDDMVDKSHVFKLLVLKNKLAKFDKLGYFAKDKAEVDKITKILDTTCSVIDLSELDSAFQNRYLAFLYERLKERKDVQIFLELSNIVSKKNLKNILESIVPTAFITHSKFKYLNDIKNLFDNFIISPSLTNNEIFKVYNTFLKAMPKGTYLIAGEAVNYIPLISSMKLINDIIPTGKNTENINDDTTQQEDIQNNIGSIDSSEQVNEKTECTSDNTEPVENCSEEDLEDETANTECTEPVENSSEEDLEDETTNTEYTEPVEPEVLNDEILQDEEFSKNKISNEEILVNIIEKSDAVIMEAAKDLTPPSGNMFESEDDTDNEAEAAEETAAEETEIEDFAEKQTNEDILEELELDNSDEQQEKQEILEEIELDNKEDYTTDANQEQEYIDQDLITLEETFDNEDNTVEEIQDYIPQYDNSENTEEVEALSLIDAIEQVPEEPTELSEEDFTTPEETNIEETEIEIPSDFDLDIDSDESLQIDSEPEEIDKEDYHEKEQEVIPVSEDDSDFEEIVELDPEEVGEDDIVIDMTEDEDLQDAVSEENLDKQIVKDVDKVFTTRKDDDISDSDLDFIDELNSDDGILEEVSDEDDTLEELSSSEEQDVILEDNSESITLQEDKDDDILETKNSSTPIVPVYDADIPQEDMVMSDPIQQGDTVTHAKYGSGVVEKMIKYGNKTLFSINFDNIGRRLLDPTLTEIKKA